MRRHDKHLSLEEGHVMIDDIGDLQTARSDNFFQVMVF